MTNIVSKEPKDISIHKRNEMIRGGNAYSLAAQRLGNGIYHHVQINKLYESKPFKIPIRDVRSIMKLDNNNAYVEVVKRSLKELSTPFVLYNANDLIPFHTKGKETLWKSVQFLLEPEIIKEGKNIYISGRMSDNIRVLIANSNEGNFTQLILNTHLNNVKSKHSYALYEYIMSYNNHPQYKNRLELRQERLDHMFNLLESKKYKYFSSFLQVLERCIIDINDNTDMYLKLAVDKKAKKYIIYRIREFKTKVNVPTKFIENTKKNLEDAPNIFSHPNGLFAT